MSFLLNIKTAVIGAVIILLVIGGIYVKGLQDKVRAAEQVAQGKEALAKDLQAKVTLQGNTVAQQQRDINDLVQYKEKYKAAEATLSISVKENAELKKKISGYNEATGKLTGELAIIQEKMKHAKTPEEYKQLQEEANKIQNKLDDLDKKLKAAYDQLQQLTIEVQGSGPTFRLGGGVTMSDTIKPSLDCKLFFIDRFSFIAGAAFNVNDIKDLDLFVACTYHIDGLALPIINNMHNLEIGLGPRYNFIQNNTGLLLILRTNF